MTFQIISNRIGGLSVAITAIALTLFLSLPALAAQDSGKTKKTGGSTPGQWVWVGYDLDQDGFIDYSEYIFSIDLEEAQKKSRARNDDNQQNQQMAQGSQQTMQKRRGARNRSAGEMKTVTGRVKSVKQVDLVGMEQKQTIARVQTQDGRTARVYLGSTENLSRMDLKEGDSIQVRGSRGTINDKGMLMARKIRSGGKVMTVKQNKAGHLKKLSGEIITVKTASFKKSGVADQVFARIKLDNNVNTVVDLGPKDQLKGIQPKELEGKKVTLLAHRATIGGATALVARQMRVDDQTIDIDWAKLAKKGSGNQQKQ